MGKTIHSNERALILKVLAFFEREKELKKLENSDDVSKRTKGVKLEIPDAVSKSTKGVIKRVSIPVNQPVNRTCAATGISKSTLMRIKKQVRSVSPVPGSSSSDHIPRPPTPGKKRRSKKRINIDKFDYVALRNIINGFYLERREVPTLEKILAAAKQEINFPGERTTLRYILKNQLGYIFKKCKNGRLVLVQKPDVAAWRARYLRRMKENNDLGTLKKTVTYVNVTSIQISGDATLKKNKDPSQSWILVHAGGEHGFIPGAELLYKCNNKTGDYQNKMDTKQFVRWLRQQLLPNLPPNGIVVIENAPYNSAQFEKTPSQSALKGEMESWLIQHNIMFNKTMTKPELYHIIRANKSHKKYVVDELLREHGHEVVRLPPYHCDLNPIEYIADLIKARVASQNVDKSETLVEPLIREALQSYLINQDWYREVNIVRKLEEEFWVKDRLQEDQIRQIITSNGGEESASEIESDEEKNYSDNNMSGIDEQSDDAF